MKIYVTKYCLNGEILALSVLEGSDAEWARVLLPGGTWPSTIKMGRDCFANEADALADAEKRRAKKIKSLSKQISKLQEIIFKVAE
jgi:hypothetical protein